MTSVGRRPTLTELIRILGALRVTGATLMDVDNPEAPDITITVRFSRAQLEEAAPDWVGENFKPIWLFEQIAEELAAWADQRTREEQWVSNEARYGASIDTLMAHWAQELTKNSAINPENMLTRARKQVLSGTILRLKELKERREAGGVYSGTESRREKARKAWMEDEYEAPRREEEQRRQQRQRDWQDEFVYGFDTAEGVDEDIWRQAEGLFRHFNFGDSFTGGQQRRQDPQKPQSGNKLPWYRILGVSADATKEQIKKAHRSLVKLYHPDRYKGADGHDRMTEINTARDEGLGGVR